MLMSATRIEDSASLDPVVSSNVDMTPPGELFVSANGAAGVPAQVYRDRVHWAYWNISLTKSEPDY
jgi:hypothetical protein